MTDADASLVTRPTDAGEGPSGCPLAVVGMGCLFPKADSVGGYWANIKHGVDAIREVPETHWAAADYYDADKTAPDKVYGRHGGFLDPVAFDPMRYGISPNNLEATDTTQLLGLVAAWQALEDAGYATGAKAADGRPFDRDRTGVILGVTGALELVIPLGARLGYPKWRRALREAGVDEATAADVVQRIADQYVPWQENSFPGLLGNVAAGRIANRFDLHGTNAVCDAACASSLAAIHLAALELQAGRSDLMITGGLDTFNDIFMYTCFSKTPALSPSGHSRPFSDDADGTTLGEGLGVILLKRLSDAQRDGDSIHAVLRGMGTSSDGRGKAIYAPSAEGQVRALRDAYRHSGVSPATVELVEAHGTGTKAGEAVEIVALSEVYREGWSQHDVAPWCAVGSVKSMLGHTKAAAGVAGLIKAIAALKAKVLPPTIKVERPAEAVRPGAAPVYVNTEMRPWLPRQDHPRRAGVSAFGFGGSNFHAVLEEAESAKRGPDWSGRALLLPLGASEPAGLEAELGRWATAAGREEPWAWWRAAAREAIEAFDAEAPWRLVLVGRQDVTDWQRLIASCRRMLQDRPEAASWQVPEGACFGRGPAAGAMAVLFPGQGAQRVGMLRELACLLPEMLDELAAGNAAFGENAVGQRLSDLLYPIPKFDEDARQADEAALRATWVAQPGLGAVSFGAWRALSERFGLQPAMAGGHSFGELVALAAAGRITAAELHRLACLRGRVMAAAGGQGPLAGARRGGDGEAADPGAMLAVFESADRLRVRLREAGWPLTLANHNAPEQSVLSGATAAIEAAESALVAAGVQVKRLPVAAAFHSPLVAASAGPLVEAAKAAAWSLGRFSVYANTTAEPYPESGEEAAELLGRQLAEPVRFLEQIRAMHAAGARTFVEVGPGRVLSGLVDGILDGNDHETVALSGSGAGRGGEAGLAWLLARLTAAGHPVDLTAWDPPEQRLLRFAEPPPARDAGKPGATVAVVGANYVRPRASKPQRQPVPASTPGRSMPESSKTVSPAPEAAAATVADPSPRLSHEPTPTPPSSNGQHRTPLDPMSQDRSQPTPSPSTASNTPNPQAPPNVSGQASQSPTATPAGWDTLQQGILALQQMQQQTAEVHRQYLQGQQAAQQTIQTLLRQAMGGATPPPGSSAESTSPAMDQPPVTPPPPGPATQPLSEPAPASVAPSADALTAGSPPPPEPGPSASPAIPAAEPVGESEPAPAAVAPSATPPAAPVRAVGLHRFTEALLDVVAEKTGYPVEMLELPMSMESDLGIDSIKRVEILAALQEKLPDAPPVNPEDLGQLDTLQQVVDFMGGQAGAAHGAAETAPAESAPVTRRDAVAGGVAQGLDPSRFTDALLDVVAEKTGYPVEMLELPMSMESDLGIDSIKRVEILSALQEKLPDAPPVNPEDLGQLDTLQQVVEFMSGSGQPGGLAAEPEVGGDGDHASPSVDPARFTQALLSVVAEKTGYPVEMLELPMSMESDLGIDSIKRVEILSALQERLPDAPVVNPEDLGQLDTLQQVVDFMSGPGEADTVPAPEPHATPPRPAGPSGESAGPTDTISAGPADSGLLDRWVPRLQPLADLGSRRRITGLRGKAMLLSDDGGGLAQPLAELLGRRGIEAEVVPVSTGAEAANPPPDLAGLVLLSPPEPDDAWISGALALMQRCEGPLRRSASGRGEAVLTGVTRLGGAFGFVDGQAMGPRSAAVAGLVKTAAWEWPEVGCKVVDAPADAEAAKRLAAKLFDEILLDGPREIALGPGERHYLRLSPDALPTPRTDDGWPLSPGDVVVVSGGARGVTAEVAVALAQRGAHLLLLGRSPAPEPEPDWLVGLSEEAAIKQALTERADEADRTLRGIERVYRRAMANREILRTLHRIESVGNGTQALYRQVDVRETADVVRALDAARKRLGPIRGLVHGAGVLADRTIAEKTAEQLERVWSTKVHGLEALLDATVGDELSFAALFSSSTARFGRVGQCDYAAANEVLNKAGQRLAMQRPDCRVLSVNWGPWAGGMVNPALEQRFASEGIGLIPLAAGAEHLMRELAARPPGDEPAPVEVVVLGSGSVIPPQPEPVADAEDASHSAAAVGSTPSAVGTTAASLAGPDADPSTQPTMGLAFERDLDVASHPFLASHVIGGKAVLPMAIILEWLSHGALHDHPGLNFLGLDAWQLFEGVKLDAGQSRRLGLYAAEQSVPDGEAERVTAELRTGDRVHARAEVRLGLNRPAPPDAIRLPELVPYTHAGGDTYAGHRLFHGPEMQGLTAIQGLSETGIVGQTETAPPPAQWMSRPLRSTWLADPLVIDAAYQLMILWSFEQRGCGCLPTGAGGYRQYVRAFPAGPIQVAVRVTAQSGANLQADVDFADAGGRVLARLHDQGFVADASLNEAFAANTLPAVGAAGQ